MTPDFFFKHCTDLAKELGQAGFSLWLLEEEPPHSCCPKSTAFISLVMGNAGAQRGRHVPE